jgi:hypothetical protein
MLGELAILVEVMIVTIREAAIALESETEVLAKIVDDRVGF